MSCLYKDMQLGGVRQGAPLSPPPARPYDIPFCCRLAQLWSKDSTAMCFLLQQHSSSQGVAWLLLQVLPFLCWVAGFLLMLHRIEGKAGRKTGQAKCVQAFLISCGWDLVALPLYPLPPFPGCFDLLDPLLPRKTAVPALGW